VTEYDNTNRGVMFKNDQGGNPKRPQYRGSLNVDGTDYNLSAWVRESKKDGSKFLSLTVEPKQDAPRKPKDDFVDDELPPF
jgi:hypothetical protein